MYVFQVVSILQVYLPKPCTYRSSSPCATCHSHLIIPGLMAWITSGVKYKCSVTMGNFPHPIFLCAYPSWTAVLRRQSHYDLWLINHQHNVNPSRLQSSALDVLPLLFSVIHLFQLLAAGRHSHDLRSCIEKIHVTIASARLGTIQSNTLFAFLTEVTQTHTAHRFLPHKRFLVTYSPHNRTGDIFMP